MNKQKIQEELKEHVENTVRILGEPTVKPLDGIFVARHTICDELNYSLQSIKDDIINMKANILSNINNKEDLNKYLSRLEWWITQEMGKASGMVHLMYKLNRY